MSVTSQEVRSWAAQQDPPLAKAGVRGRLSKAAVDAYNAAHAAAPYGTIAHILPVPERPEVTSEATHEGTVENPSSAALTDAVDAAQTEPLQEPGTPFTNPPEAAEGVTGEVMPQYGNPADDDDYSDGSGYVSEKYEDTP